MDFHEDAEDLLKLHEGEGVVHKPIDLDAIYRKEPEQAVSFEIAFTAFIATVSLAAPKTGTLLDLFAPWAASGLLLLTIIRRIALDNIFIDRERIFSTTLGYIAYITTFSVLYLCLALGEIFGDLLNVGPYLVTAVILVILFVVVTFGYEILFQDFMLWIAMTLYNQAIDPSSDDHRAIRIGWLMMARSCLSFSLVGYNEEHYVIKRIQDIDLEGGRKAGKIAMSIIYGLIFLLLLFVVGAVTVPLSWVLSISLLGGFLLNLALILSFTLVVGFVEFVYARYGSGGDEEAAAGVNIFIAALMMYLVILIHAGALEKGLELLF